VISPNGNFIDKKFPGGHSGTIFSGVDIASSTKFVDEEFL
jgi:hypothetical protein